MYSVVRPREFVLSHQNGAIAAFPQQGGLTECSPVFFVFVGIFALSIGRLVLIGIAVIAAGLTAFLLNYYLDQKERELADAAKLEQPEYGTEVLVAAADLASGTIVGSDSFSWHPWPDDNVNENYLVRGQSEDPAELSGSAIRSAVRAGQPIILTQIVKPSEAGFLAGALKPGMRAISIKVSEESTAAGFVLPGSYVDLILTQEIAAQDSQAANERRIVGETVLKKIRVLAIDQSTDDITENAVVGDTLTVELSPKQVEALSVAKQMGEITFALRSVANDTEKPRLDNYTQDTEVSRFLSEGKKISPRIMVAAKDIPTGTLLRDVDFEWREFDNGTDVDGLIIQATARVGQIRGAFVLTPLKKGDPIPSEELIRPAQSGFILKALRAGMRAISVSVDQLTGISGYVSPGDFVDVIMAHELKDTSETPVLSPRRFAETIVENVRVLAIEKNDDALPTLTPGVIAPQEPAETITLEVTPNQAEELALGTETGKLSIALRAARQEVAIHRAGRQIPRRPFTSDFSISDATVHYISNGTLNAPELLDYNGGWARVRVYRQAAGSTANIKR